MTAVTNVLTLSDPRAQLAAHTGGKGANLAALSGAGFPVPKGLVVTTSAYSTFIEQSELKDRIASLLAEADYTDAAAFEQTTARIRNAIIEAPMPAGLAADIAVCYRQLPEDSYVAVRSSGTAEDLAGTSFAGLHDTYLDIRGNDAVTDAVNAAGPRCGLPAPPTIATARESIMAARKSPSWSRKWSNPKSPVCCSRPIR